MTLTSYVYEILYVVKSSGWKDDWKKFFEPLPPRLFLSVMRGSF